MSNHIQTSHVDTRRNPIDFGSQVQRSRSILTFFVYNLVGMIQATVLVLSLLNIICERRNPVEFESHVKGQGQLWHSKCDTLCGHDADYKFCSITFKLHLQVVGNRRGNSIKRFWVTGTKLYSPLTLCL